jgi:hypothetical protein
MIHLMFTAGTFHTQVVVRNGVETALEMTCIRMVSMVPICGLVEDQRVLFPAQRNHS